MPAAEKLLVGIFMATAAVGRGNCVADGKAVMVLLLLIGRRLMAVEAGDILRRVSAELEFMHDGMLQLRVAFGALPGRSHMSHRRLRRIRRRPLGIDEERREDEAESNDESDEHRSK